MLQCNEKQEMLQYFSLQLFTSQLDPINKPSSQPILQTQTKQAVPFVIHYGVLKIQVQYNRTAFRLFKVVLNTLITTNAATRTSTIGPIPLDSGRLATAARSAN